MLYMNNLQSFFPGYNRWIGRGPKSALARIKSQAQSASLSSLSELSALFGRYIPEVLLQPAGRRQHSRQRVYSFRSTFWAFLSQVLSPRTACLEVVRKMQCFCSELGLPIPSSDDSAYCQARGKLDRDRLMEIHHSVAGAHQQAFRNAWLWQARQVRVVDGTGIRLPDTAENQKTFPQPSEQRKGCGFPVMQVVACFCLHTGALLHWVSSKLTAHESPLLRGLLALLEPGDVVLADRGFSSYSNLALCLKHRLDAVMRLHQARKVDLRRGRPTMPITMNVMETRVGVHKSIASFTVPLGATINMDGTAIMQGIATVFIAQAYGLDLSMADYLAVIATATLASIGTAGVPGVGLIMLSMVLQQVGLPVEGIGLIIGVDRLLDMMRTVVNVTGDGMVTTVVARSEGLLDEAVFNEVSDRDQYNT